MSEHYPHSTLILDFEFSRVIRTWLIENIGLPHHTWATEYAGLGYTRIKFLREEDKILFLLKWS